MYIPSKYNEMVKIRKQLKSITLITKVPFKALIAARAITPLENLTNPVPSKTKVMNYITKITK